MAEEAPQIFITPPPLPPLGSPEFPISASSDDSTLVSSPDDVLLTHMGTLLLQAITSPNFRSAVAAYDIASAHPLNLDTPSGFAGALTNLEKVVKEQLLPTLRSELRASYDSLASSLLSAVPSGPPGNSSSGETPVVEPQNEGDGALGDHPRLELEQPFAQQRTVIVDPGQSSPVAEPPASSGPPEPEVSVRTVSSTERKVQLGGITVDDSARPPQEVQPEVSVRTASSTERKVQLGGVTLTDSARPLQEGGAAVGSDSAPQVDCDALA
eukprot:RCo030970